MHDPDMMDTIMDQRARIAQLEKLLAAKTSEEAFPKQDTATKEGSATECYESLFYIV